MKHTLSLLLFFLAINTWAQRDKSWMNDYGNVTDWGQYITVSPKYMGPFALPVPSIYPAEIESKERAQLGYVNYQCHEGEAPTNASVSAFYYSFPSQRVAIEVTMMMNETYTYSDAMADYYHAFNTEGSGGGDVCVNTYVSILKEKKYLPSVTLRYALRTASGSDLNDARHVNAAAYYFDLAFGKDVYKDEHSRLRYYALGGFYVWQLMNYENFQNDASMYGVGMMYQWKDFKVKWDLGGYHGYRNEGDSPWVMRCNLDIPIYKSFLLNAQWEYGLRDFPYTGLMFNLVYQFDTK